jgi:mannose-6-phosphate isomerase-like protein (cupin superfamily)
MLLLTKKEIENIFNDGFLYENNSFFVIDKNKKEYNTNLVFETYLETASYIRKYFLEGHTIVVKNLENYNKNIRHRCADLGRDVDVHMYLVPTNGEDSFNFHTDDREVIIEMIYGKKDFIFRNKETLQHHSLREGDTLKIPLGVEHKAVPKGSSCLLSFGINTREYYSIYGGIRNSDL